MAHRYSQYPRRDLNSQTSEPKSDGFARFAHGGGHWGRHLARCAFLPQFYEIQAINDNEMTRAHTVAVRLNRTSVPVFQWRYRELHPSPREFRMRAFPLVETNLSPKWTRRDLNAQSSACKAGALPDYATGPESG